MSRRPHHKTNMIDKTHAASTNRDMSNKKKSPKLRFSEKIQPISAL
jgi:hypothetical protein